MNDCSYLLIGGDERQKYLYKILKDKHKKVEKIFLNENENISNAYKKICDYDIIILPIPATKDGQTLFTPNSNGIVMLDDIFNKASETATIFMGGEYKNSKNSQKVINLLSDESLTLKNAMATAEATLSIIIRETNHTVFGAKILIIGYGRIGKILADYLFALKARVSICARKEMSRTKAMLSGFNAFNFENLKQNLPHYDIIINTVPTLILKKEELTLINENSLIVDLASNPGGVDFKSAEKIGLKTIHALALPGLYSPKSAAKFIEQTIDNRIMQI